MPYFICYMNQNYFLLKTKTLYRVPEDNSETAIIDAEPHNVPCPILAPAKKYLLSFYLLATLA